MMTVVQMMSVDVAKNIFDPFGAITGTVNFVKADIIGSQGDESLRAGNYPDAHAYYTQSLKIWPHHWWNHHNIALVYEMIPEAQATQALTRDYFKAAQHYLIAIDCGSSQSAGNLHRLQSGDLPANVLNQLGVLYHNGAIDIPRIRIKPITTNLIVASEIYLRAAQKGSNVALRNFGLIKENQGNYFEAAKHYQKAIDAGYVLGKEDLNRVLQIYDLDGATLNAIAQLYKDGTEVRQDASEHIKLLKRAMAKGCAAAFANYGLCLQDNFGITRDYCEAAMYLRQAEARGFPQAQEKLNHLLTIADEGTKVYIQSSEAMATLRTNTDITNANLKKIFRTIVHNHFLRNGSQLGDIEQTDQRNWTLLHHASMYRPSHVLYKICARLCCLNADTSRVNAEGKQPFTDLTPAQMRKITDLQGGIITLLNNLEMGVPEVVSGRIFSHGGRINVQDTIDSLRSLYRDEALKPLLELAKLACLGLHDLAARDRPRCAQLDYDSDDDNSPEIIRTEEYRLKFIFDITNRTVEGISHYGPHGRGGCCHVGVYQFGNEIFVGARPISGGGHSKEQIRGTFIHELTHFVAHEVYLNNCDPYASTDVNNRNLFSEITDELRLKHEKLPDVLKAAFTYPQNEQQRELIVRVAQMFAENPSGARAILQRDAPRLLNYYEHAFLPAVRAHCAKIEERVLKGWPKEMFAAMRTRNLAFQTA